MFFFPAFKQTLQSINKAPSVPLVWSQWNSFSHLYINLPCLSPVAIITWIHNTCFFEWEINSKWRMLIQVASCVLGDIKILKMHFSGFFGVKVHNFCVNAIPAPGRKFTSLGWTNPCAINNLVKILPVFVYCSDLMADHNVK